MIRAQDKANNVPKSPEVLINLLLAAVCITLLLLWSVSGCYRWWRSPAAVVHKKVSGEANGELTAIFPNSG